MFKNRMVAVLVSAGILAGTIGASASLDAEVAPRAAYASQENKTYTVKDGGIANYILGSLWLNLDNGTSFRTKIYGVTAGGGRISPLAVDSGRSRLVTYGMDLETFKSKATRLEGNVITVGLGTIEIDFKDANSKIIGHLTAGAQGAGAGHFWAAKLNWG